MSKRGDHSRRMCAAAGLAALALACAAGARADESAPAGQVPANAGDASADDGLVKSIAKKLGIAVDPPRPADFVVKERPKQPEPYVPTGRRPWPPGAKVKTPDELKALEDDLDAVEKRADALRAAFPPAAKAVAERKAEKAKKRAPAANPQ